MRILFSGRVNLQHQKQENVITSIENLFNKMGVEFVTIADEIKCGEAAMNLGITDDARKVVEKFKTQIDEIKPDLIVSPFAAGVAKYREEVPRKYGIDIGVPYIHLSEFLAENIGKFKEKFSPFPHSYFIHHGCTLGRKIREFNYIREILNMIPEIKIMEEDHPTAELEHKDVAQFNTCPGSWLNMSQPELSEYLKENYIMQILVPANPEYAGSSCANGHYGILQGLEIAEVDSIKPLYFAELFDKVWR